MIVRPGKKSHFQNLAKLLERLVTYDVKRLRVYKQLRES